MMGHYEIENNCTLCICTDNYEIISINEIQKKIESHNVEKKIEGMENLIFNIIHGETYGNILMSVIRFVVPDQNHRLKKLTHIFFEIVDKCNSDGSLKEEMILVCNALRNDIISANEYIRGSTLRLLGKIKYLKILDPLLEEITKNLNHRHSYVRKNAINCIHNIIKEFGIDVLPNSIKEIEKILFIENDISTKCSALSMLTDIDPMITLKYILCLDEKLYESADVIQLEVLHLFKKLYISHVFDDIYLLTKEDTEEKEENEEFKEDDNEEEDEDDEEDDMNNEIDEINNLCYGENNKNNIYNKENKCISEKTNNINENDIDLNKKNNQNDYNQYKNNVIKILLNMLNRNVSNSVLYEGACCLLYMSNSVVSIKTAIECFIKLLINQHDNNIRLIVIDKLYYIMCKWKYILENYIMDLLRALSFPSKDIKIKILNLILHILTGRNVQFVLNVLKKELLKLDDQEGSALNLSCKNLQKSSTQFNNIKNLNGLYPLNNITSNYSEIKSYKKILIKAFQHISNMFPEECINIIDLLLLYSNDEEKEINYESAICIRQLVNNKNLRNNILQKLSVQIFEIKRSTILRIFFWIIGQYMNDHKSIFEFMQKLYENFYFFLKNSNEPYVINKIQTDQNKENKMNFSLYNPNILTKTVILKDGTYATEAFMQNLRSMSNDSINLKGKEHFSYNLLYKNDDILLCVICVCLTKLYLKLLSNTNSFSFLRLIKKKKKKKNKEKKTKDFYNFSDSESTASNSDEEQDECEDTEDENSNLNESNINNNISESYGSINENTQINESFVNNEEWRNMFNEFRNKSIHILASIIKYILHKNSKFEISIFENDSNVIRINQCLKIFLKITDNKKIEDKQTKNLIKTFINGDLFFQKFLEKEEEKYYCLYGSNYKNIKKQRKKLKLFKDNEEKEITNQDLLNKQETTNVDDDIFFRILKEKKNILNKFDEENVPFNENLEILKLKYTLNNDILFEENELKYPVFKHNYSSFFLYKLHNTQRLTGIDDDIFVEAFPIVSNINLIIKFYVYNQTDLYLQNIHINLSTHSNFKPIDKIPFFDLSPNEKKKFKITVKVHTTETGTIFGYIFYENKNERTKNYIVLNELNINMTDYINTSFISSHLFRLMWSEFEWENKININTSLRDVFELLKLVIKNTNMTIVEKFMPLEYYELETKNKSEHVNINPIDTYISYISSLDDLKCLINNSSFFAVNLFSRSVFGEDSLANISIQKNPDGKLSGSIRVRSRTQRIALSLGDKITVIQTGANLDS